jgi:hypothetical protein
MSETRNCFKRIYHMECRGETNKNTKCELAEMVLSIDTGIATEGLPTWIFA